MIATQGIQGIAFFEATACLTLLVLFVHLKRDLPTYRKVRMDYLLKPYPASTALGVTELAIPGLEIEIEAVAIL